MLKIEELDISNTQVVGANGSDVVVMMPKPRMTKTEALIQAAWLVAIADQSENFEDFRAILRKVLGT